MFGAKRQILLVLLGLAMSGVLTAAQRGGQGGQQPPAAGQVPPCRAPTKRQRAREALVVAHAAVMRRLLLSV